MTQGVPDHIRSDNGSEFTSKNVRSWLKRVGVKTVFIAPGSPWEIGYVESFNGKLRDELLLGGIFCTLKEAKVLIGRRGVHYDTVGPQSSLGYRPPAPEPIAPIDLASAALQPDQLGREYAHELTGSLVQNWGEGHTNWKGSPEFVAALIDCRCEQKASRQSECYLPCRQLAFKRTNDNKLLAHKFASPGKVSERKYMQPLFTQTSSP